jgi:hypothetical protein
MILHPDTFLDTSYLHIMFGLQLSLNPDTFLDTSYLHIIMYVHTVEQCFHVSSI